MGRPCIKGIDVGNFDKRIIFQSLQEIADGGGGFKAQWTDILTSWAQIKPLKSYERFQAMQVETPVTHKIYMRYRNDMVINTKLRIKFGQRIFNVASVIDIDEQKAFLEILAVEGTAT